MIYSLIIKKLKISLQIFFLIISVLFFSSIPPITKFFLGLILIFLNLIQIFSDKKSQQHKIFLFIGIFYFYLLFNIYLVSKIPFESKFEFLNYILYFLTFIVFIKFRKDELEKSLTISFFLIQTIVFVLYLFGKNKIIYFLLYNPNIICSFNLAVFFFSLFYIQQTKIPTLKFLGSFNILFSLFSFFIFKNFTAFFILFLFVIFLLPSKNILFKFFILTFLLVLGVVYNFTSFFDRIIWMLIGLKIFFEKPIFGVGLGCFKFYYPAYSIYLPLTSTATSYIHNYFLHLSTELGIIGLFFIIFVIFYSYKNYKINKEKIFFFPLIFLILSNLLDYNLAIPQNAILFSVLTASLGSNTYDKKESLKFSWFEFLIISILFLNLFFLSIKLHKINYLINISDKDSLRKALSIDKSCWYAYKNLAIFEIKEGNLNEAFEFLNKTLKYNPIEAETYFYISLLKFKIGEKNEAFKFHKKATILNPKAALRYKKEIKDLL